MSREILSAFASRIKNLCDAGGPKPGDYAKINEGIRIVSEAVAAGDIKQDDVRAVLDDLGEPFTAETMQGLALRKPRGYAGDFEMIEKIYSKHMADKENLRNWDIYFHSQHAPIAVRNRKAYFQNLLDNLPSGSRVLKLGVGPGRGMFEWLSINPNKDIHFECVDVDANAIEYARNLNQNFSTKISFNHVNVFKFTPPPQPRNLI